MLIRLEIFIKRKIRHYFGTYFQKDDQARLENKNFVIISRNCWGGQAYQWLGIPYNTPFVGLFLFGPCYMKLLRDFDAYMQMELDFCKTSKYEEAYCDYPIGLLGDVEIHFQHYKDKEEAREKWLRRRDRMLTFTNKDNYFFTICDRRRTSAEDILEFHKMNFKHKLSFSFYKIQDLSKIRHIRFIKDPRKKKGVPSNGKKRFKLTFLYFDLVKWLNTGNVVRTRFKQ